MMMMVATDPLVLLLNYCCQVPSNSFKNAAALAGFFFYKSMDCSWVELAGQLKRWFTLCGVALQSGQMLITSSLILLI